MPTTTKNTGNMPKPPVKHTFFSRNLVTIVMIPSLIGIHYAWTLMQENRTLVSEREKIDLPVVTFAKYCWRNLTGNETGKVETVVPTVTAAK